MANGDEASAKILESLEEEIQGLLDDPAKSTKELVRGMLHVMKTQNPFLIQSLADHVRVMKMWNGYRVATWLAAPLSLLILGLLFEILTHRVELVFAR